MLPILPFALGAGVLLFLFGSKKKPAAPPPAGYLPGPGGSSYSSYPSSGLLLSDELPLSSAFEQRQHEYVPSPFLEQGPGAGPASASASYIPHMPVPVQTQARAPRRAFPSHKLGLTANVMQCVGIGPSRTCWVRPEPRPWNDAWGRFGFRIPAGYSVQALARGPAGWLKVRVNHPAHGVVEGWMEENTLARG